MTEGATLHLADVEGQILLLTTLWYFFLSYLIATVRRKDNGSFLRQTKGRIFEKKLRQLKQKA